MRTICDRIDRFAPIISGRHIGGAIEGFYSNELWYALYSTKGLAVFEGETMNAEEEKNTVWIKSGMMASLQMMSIHILML